MKEENSFVNQNDNPLNQIKAATTFNLTDARKYAETYYKDYNSSYPKYSSDCTNYVSQTCWRQKKGF